MWCDVMAQNDVQNVFVIVQKKKLHHGSNFRIYIQKQEQLHSPEFFGERVPGRQGWNQGQEIDDGGRERKGIKSKWESSLTGLNTDINHIHMLTGLLQSHQPNTHVQWDIFGLNTHIVAYTKITGVFNEKDLGSVTSRIQELHEDATESSFLFCVTDVLMYKHYIRGH